MRCSGLLDLLNLSRAKHIHTLVHKRTSQLRAVDAVASLDNAVTTLPPTYLEAHTNRGKNHSSELSNRIVGTAQIATISPLVTCCARDPLSVSGGALRLRATGIGSSSGKPKPYHLSLRFAHDVTCRHATPRNSLSHAWLREWRPGRQANQA